MFQRITQHPLTPVILIWSCLACLPFGRLVELPVLIMAVSAIVLMVRGGIAPLTGRYRLFSLAFLAVIIPVVLSVPDAVEPGKAAKILLHVRFYLAGLFIVWALDTQEKADKLLGLISWLLVFWVLDSLVQFAVGVDLFGRSYVEERLSGIFGEDLKQGLVIAAIVAIPLTWFKPRLPVVLFVLISLSLLFTILAGGSRGSWIFLLITVACLLISAVRRNRLFLFPAIGLALTLFLVLPISAYYMSPMIEARFDRTMLLFSGDYKKIDRALSYRLSLWENAYKMVKDHPINGVGARNYRYAYEEYAAEDDLYVHELKTQPAHPHQLAMEFAAETGLVGLSGLVLLYAILFKGWFSAPRLARKLALPLGISLYASLFPINTHLALFSSFWGQFIWWLIALFFAFLSLPRELDNEG